MKQITVILFAMVLAVVMAASCAVEDLTVPAAPGWGEVSAKMTDEGLLLSAELSSGAFVRCGFCIWRADEGETYAMQFKGIPNESGTSFTSMTKGIKLDTDYVFYAYASNGLDESRSKVQELNFRVGDNARPVDLGLSVNWASCNIGARWPEEGGMLFQWAGVEAAEIARGETLGYEKCPYHDSSWMYDSGWTRYVTSDCPGWSSNQSPDNLKTLLPEDDAAHVILGGKWRMPTAEECSELLTKCSVQVVTDYNETGVTGLVITGKKEGYTDRSIFVPYLDGDKANKYWTFWTSSLDEEECHRAFSAKNVPLYYYSVKTTSLERYKELAVRAVCPKK